MSISGSLYNALSGLTAASRAAELTSSNVANAMTEGYGRRDLALSSVTLSGSGGVRIDGVVRNVNDQLIADRRLADASLGHDRLVADFYAEMEGLIGTPDEAWSLTGRLANLEATLIEAGSDPSNEARLSAVLEAARGVANRLGDASEGIQATRMRADSAISREVDALNKGLVKVQNLNYAIQRALASGQEPAALMDVRQKTIDAMGAIVPMKQVSRDHGTVALFTPGGAILLDGRASVVGFSATGVIVPGMTTDPGPLSGLTINGTPAATSGRRIAIADGSLAAHFDVRDSLAAEAQSRLDAVARDLVERLQDPGVDPTLTLGDAGLFTDAGTAFDTVDEVGLSQRLAINAAADPGQGGALWRLRDGLGAITQGDAGNASLLNAISDALTTGRVPASGGFLGASHSASGLAGEFLSVIGAARQQADAAQGASVAQQEALKRAELADGVDTDQEMQKLMLIEQAYAANAKVMTAADDMLQLILQI